VRNLAIGSLLALLLPSSAWATKLNQEEGILPNHSAQFVRTLNRNASTDADAAFYNPAGLAFLAAPGLHVMLSAQSYGVRRTHSLDYYGLDVDGRGNTPTSQNLDSFAGRLPEKYFAETLAPIVPDLDIIYKAEKWAAFFDLSVMQAAPGLEFPEGLAILDWGNLAPFETVYETSGSRLLLYARDALAVRTEYYVGTTVGGSYALRDWLSAAFGVRYINARGNQTIRIKDAVAVTDTTDLSDPTQIVLPDWNIDTDTRGHGFGFVAGLHARPRAGIDVGFRYEYYAPMNLDKTTNKLSAPMAVEMSGQLDIFKDGTPGKDMEYQSGNGDATLRVTYPQSFSLGVSVEVLEALRVEVSSQLSLRSARNLDGREDYWRLGFRAGGCLEWQMSPVVVISGGYLYNDFGIKPEHRTEIDPLLTSHTLGGGFELTVNGRLSITVGGFYSIYVTEEIFVTEFTDITAPTDHYLAKRFDEQRLSVAIGLTYRFLGGN
jgi:long-chain fatty acid transport protein